MTAGPALVGASTVAGTLLPADALVAASATSTASDASFAATLAQLTSSSSAPTTPTALSDGLFVGDLGVAAPSPGVDGAVAGLASEMALLAQLAPAATSPTATTGAVATSTVPVARVARVRAVGVSAVIRGAVTGGDIVGTALAYRGTPYVWGGTSPSGFDCSGFTQYVYARWGIAIPRTSEQQATIGAPVASLASAQPGDLLFFAGSDGTASSPGHVGIYVGNGEMIDSPYTGTTVQVQPLSSAGPIVAIRRVLGSAA